jgi:hypothetical protein
MNKKNLQISYTDLTLRAKELKDQNWKITFYSVLLFGLFLGLDIASFIAGIDPQKINFFRFLMVIALVLVMEFGVSILLISSAELLRIKRRIQICRNLFDDEVLEFLNDHKDYERWYNQYNILFQVITIVLTAILLLLFYFGLFSG